LIDSGSPDDGSDIVIISDGVVKPLQDYDTNSFSTTIAIGSCIEGIAFTIGTQKVQRSHWHHRVWGQDQTRTSGKTLDVNQPFCPFNAAGGLLTRSISPSRRAWQALWTHTKLALQPVSIVMLGPLTSRK
jgi:hypothetical protein